jgi:hypothetical protein
MLPDDAKMQTNRKNLQQFLPRTLDERLARLQERMQQAWPTFGSSGLSDGWYKLHISYHEAGTVIRFFADDAMTFDDLGAVKHGAYWHLSHEVEGRKTFTNRQMQAYLSANKLNWVEVK